MKIINNQQVRPKRDRKHKPILHVVPIGSVAFPMELHRAQTANRFTTVIAPETNSSKFQTDTFNSNPLKQFTL